MKALRKDILNAEGMEERRCVFQEYNLVSKDVSLEVLKQGMLERAQDIGVNPDIVPTRIRIRPPILLSFLDKVDVIYFGGVSARIGLSPLMGIISKILKIQLPGVDIVDICAGIFGIINARGIFANDLMVSVFSIGGVAGFVGTSVKLPFIMHVFNGYSAVTFGIGTGIHIKTISVPTPT
jgi:hypothetical protein